MLRRLPLSCQPVAVGHSVVISLDEVWRRHAAGAYEGSPTLTVEQTRVLLGQDSIETIYRWLRTGIIPGYQIGRSWVIYRDMLRDYMESERAEREQRHDPSE